MSVRLATVVGLCTRHQHSHGASAAMGSAVARFRYGSRSGSVTGVRTDAPAGLLSKARSQPQSMSDQEWREVLGPHTFDVARNAGTERAFSGHLWDHKETGSYQCVCCDAPLFQSEAKFDSGSGWPSFSEVASGAAIEEKRDASLGMVRTEVTCGRCQAHLGHVFDDGPAPSRMRYCINSASLAFQKRGSSEKK